LCRKELANLDKFREHQKMIEELNARKKKMLSEAIKQRYLHFVVFLIIVLVFFFLVSWYK